MVKKTKNIWIVPVVIAVVLLIMMVPGATQDLEQSLVRSSGVAKQTGNSGDGAGDIVTSDTGRAGTCSVSGLANCWEERESYGGARAVAKIAYSSPYDTGDWGENFVIDYYCGGNEFKYVFRNRGEYWLNVDDDGINGGRSASRGYGELVFTRTDIESAPSDSNGHTYVHLVCWDKDTEYYDDGSYDWAWAWAGYWLEIAPSDMGCVTDSQCPTKQKCDVSNKRCVPVDCKIDSDCSLGLSCIDYSCGCSADSDCGDREKCDTSTRSCTSVECKQDSECTVGICIGYSCGCRTNTDCDEKQVCEPSLDQCMGVQCTADIHCSSNSLGDVCLSNNVCGCNAEADCNTNQICRDNWCLDVDCKTDQDCPTMEMCLDNNCISANQMDYDLYIDSAQELDPGESIEKTFSIDTENLVKGSSGYIDFWVSASDKPQTTQVTKHYAFVFEKEVTT